MKFPASCPFKTLHVPANFTAKPKHHVQKLLGKISGHSKPNHIGNSVQVLTKNSSSFSISTTFKDEIEQELENSSSDKSWIHLVGIGGCGLSALAMLALKHVYGFYQVTWSFNRVMRLVLGYGIKQLHGYIAGSRGMFYIVHSMRNIQRSSALRLPDETSTAIPQDNVENLYVELVGVPVLSMALFALPIEVEATLLTFICV